MCLVDLLRSLLSMLYYLVSRWFPADEPGFTCVNTIDVSMGTNGSVHGLVDMLWSEESYARLRWIDLLRKKKPDLLRRSLSMNTLTRRARTVHDRLVEGKEDEEET